MVGIACSQYFGISLLFSFIVLVLSLAAMFLAMSFERLRLLFGVGATVAMFAIGALLLALEAPERELQWSGTKGRFEAQLLEVPKISGAATRVLSYVRRIGRDSVPDARREGFVYLYFANSVDVEQLQIGENIWFEAKVESPRNAGNPAELDIERLYKVRDISGTLYLPYKGWTSRGVGDLSWKMRALMLRDRVVQLYERLGVEGEALSVLSALTVGEKGELPKSTKRLYSSVGASHILALSGLHLGIFYMIISALLPMMYARRRYMLLRESVIVGVIWCFAAVAGFTPSVVRAAILFSLMSLAKVIARETSSMNILAFAAVAMLIYSPYYLYDLSFQLSFAAVFSIILLVPPLRSLMCYERCGNAVGRYIISLVAMSVAAQLGTLPFVWCYFGTFPLYFLLTNMVVVPLAFLIMLLALLLLFPIGPLQQVLAWLLQNIIDAMNYLLRLIASLPGSSLELPYIDIFGAFAVALVLMLFVHSFLCRKKWSFVSAGILSALFAASLFYKIYWGVENERYILFFNEGKRPLAQLVASRESSYILSSYSLLDYDDYILEPYLKREAMEQPQWLNDPFADGIVTYVDGMVEFSGRRIMMLADDCWREEEDVRPVDCLYLCRGFLGSMEELFTVYPATFVLMDASLYSSSRRRIARECAAMGVRCIDIAQTGALRWDCCDLEILVYPAR